ncbi:MAG: hypothetical protein WAK82_26365 [Streptosporangiaceae bacterium]
MAEGGDPEYPDVVLGLGAAWGFAPADQTSPALAGAAGALIDTAMTDQPVTELRIHGVSGSDGPTILEHPQTLQVAGDGTAGFFRRWSPDGRGQPSVPWKLEAYSWGGLTEKPLASAAWLLLAPFMMYNVAYFMLPPPAAGSDSVEVSGPVPHMGRGRGAAIAHVLLRLLALAATIQFTAAVVSVTVSTIAWQAAGQKNTLLPNWMGWYGDWTAGWRIALALAAVAGVVGVLWWVSVTTASKYEARTTTARPALAAEWPLTQPGFWRGQELLGRQRALHAAAACSSAALVAALPSGHPAGAHWVAVGFAAAVLAAVVWLLVMPMADRHTVTMAQGGRKDSGADTWCRSALVAALIALVFTALLSGWTDGQPGRQAGALPGLAGFLAVLLAVQAALLIMLAVTVRVLASQADAAKDGFRPYLGGGLAALIATLGFTLGGMLTAVISVGVTRLLGAPAPSGFRFGNATPDTIAVPWPVYAFGAAPVGLLLGGAAAAVLLGRIFVRRCRSFRTPAAERPSQIAAAYADLTAGVPGSSGDQQTYDKQRGAIARTWAIGLIADEADAAVALILGGGLIVVLAAEIACAVSAGPAGHPAALPSAWHGLAAVISLLVIAVAGGLVALLRQAYSDPAKRKTIGALWDVATFWPRAVHPLAPPCYAERAVPEVVDRIRLLTGRFTDAPGDVAELHYQAGLPDSARTRGLTVPAGPVLLTGYSQGSIIAPAVIAQLPPEVIPRVALLTLACPARRLYGRAFPAFFGPGQLTELADLLGATAPGQEPVSGRPPGRWKNLRRRSDYIGSWIFTEPLARLSQADLDGNIDQPCWDPVILVPDANLTPPPTHRHSQWWQDPRVNEIGAYLVDLLGG